VKTYVIITAVVFGLLALVHVWRMIEEGPHVARDPFFIISTVVAVALCLWAGRVLWRMRRQPDATEL
jgi:hypothetical protein